MGMSTAAQSGWLNTAGYPGDKTYGTQWFNAKVHPASGSDTTSDKLMYTFLDVYPGQSGSPAWQLISNSGSRYIKGVVSHQACATSMTSSSGVYCTATSTSSGYNGIVQLDNTHFNNILAWR